MPTTAFGSFVLVLHSHLPYYRKAGMWPFGEENLYECMAETYIPLANMLNELLDEGIQAKVTLGITPVLAEQLADPHLQHGFNEYCDARLKAVQEDCERYPDPKVEHSEHLAFLANWYRDWWTTTKRVFNETYNRDLIAAFRQLQDAGAIEILTSAATHGFLPLLGRDESIQGQLRTGVETYKKYFGRAPKGIWLPECAYRPAQEEHNPITGEVTIRPSVDAHLHSHGLEHFFTEFHAIEGGVSCGSRRVVGAYGNIAYIPMPARPETGLTTYEAYWLKNYPVSVMARNDRASFQVWSAAHGYPGDGMYREFHKKDVNSGMHYWRLTSKDAELGFKMLYDPVQAFEKTKENADHFVTLVYHMMRDRYLETGEHQLIMVSFDTELYGHWWFEGVAWLKHMIRAFHQCDNLTVESSTDYLANNPPRQAIHLPESTWGQGGHYWVWNNEHTEWMWPLIHAAEHRMADVVKAYQDETEPLRLRVLNQIFRELLLLQSSDWPFLVTTFQAKDYAIERFMGHHERFWRLVKMMEFNQIDEAALAEIEDVDCAFDNIDFRWFNNHQLEPANAALLPEVV
jgi:1,4-alpha-glucan branching enzyme